MEKDFLIFTGDELDEIQALEIIGGGSASPLAQASCADDGCVDIHPGCSHKGCIIERECPGHIDTGCVNSGCGIIKPPQPGQLCNVGL